VAANTPVLAGQRTFVDRLRDSLRHQDMLFAAGLVVLVALLVLPMPTWVVDIGLSASITLSVLILMVAIWIDKPLDFSSFPTVLLVATLLRLALDLATTRLILSGGHKGLDAAGSVINGFAGFVVGGDFVIGVVVFAILIVINFMVITKGAGRIAEVSARFSLDAMPGKQMAIDADLSAGMINDQEARRRRKELESESSFFGAMDGASKFVRGDAVAAIIITLVNMIGGMVIGTMRHDLSVSQAAMFYTTLTIGEGIVSQIPALTARSLASSAATPNRCSSPQALQACSRCCRACRSCRSPLCRRPRPAARCWCARPTSGGRRQRRRRRAARKTSVVRVRSRSPN
jgi:flagellar biosynthesis protein FlhA